MATEEARWYDIYDSDAEMGGEKGDVDVIVDDFDCDKGSANDGCCDSRTGGGSCTAATMFASTRLIVKAGVNMCLAMRRWGSCTRPRRNSVSDSSGTSVESREVKGEEGEEDEEEENGEGRSGPFSKDCLRG